jgi:GNAT superfamily N-acetyltransferase
VYDLRMHEQLTLRKLDASDLGACLDLGDSRGWPRESAHWAALMAVGDVLGVDHPAHSGLAGTVTAISYGKSLGAIGMLLVSLDLSRQGLGRSLMSIAMRQLNSENMLLCSTPEGHRLYESIGFSDCGQAYELAADNDPSQHPWDQAVRSYAESDWDSVIRLDQRTVGGDRSRLLRYLFRTSLITVVADAEGGPAGYGCAWDNGDSVIIGPVISRTSDDAFKIISSLRSRFSGICVLNCGLDQIEVRDWALKAGFEMRRSLPVMIHGNAALTGYRSHYFCLASLALA